MKQARRFGGSPAQRMKDFPGIDHRLQPGALFRGALHRQKQRQQLVPVGRPGVFAQRLTEGDVLCLRLRGKAGGVGRHEGEGVVGIAAVFRQIEVTPADQVPGGVQRGQEGLQSGPRGGEGRCERPCHLIPQRQQDVLGQIFRPGHHRRGQHQGGKFRRGGRRYVRRLAAVFRFRAGRVQTQRPDVPGREVTPPDKHRGQGPTNLARAEPHQPMPGSHGERLGQAD